MLFCRVKLGKRGKLLTFRLTMGGNRICWNKEQTIEELVSITGLTASNIKVKLHRIRKKLFVLLNGMDHE